MKNTTFRRRALVSSVAMLLVAMLALGSATFAWFSTKQQADAFGLSGGTTKSSSLVIKEVWADDWANSIEFKAATADVATALTPVTFDGTTWQTTTSAGYDLGYQGESLQSVSVSNTYAAFTSVYVKYGETGGTDAKDLRIKVAPKTGLTSDKLAYARVAIVPVAEAANEALALGTVKILGADNNDLAAAPSGYTSKNAANNTAVTALYSATATTPLNMGAMTCGAIYKYMIYVYFEGTDKDCIDSKAGVSVDNFVFDFSVTDHT